MIVRLGISEAEKVNKFAATGEYLFWKIKHPDIKCNRR